LEHAEREASGSKAMEMDRQTTPADRLGELLNLNCTFWSSVEDTPWSRLAGIMLKRRGCRTGVPDLLDWHRGRRVGIVSKSLFGVVSAAQREVRLAMPRAEVEWWWWCRTATSALVTLHRARAPVGGWLPPLLEAWEEPVRDPDLTVWHPAVLR